jgi:hypothetical protein
MLLRRCICGRGSSGPHLSGISRFHLCNDICKTIKHPLFSPLSHLNSPPLLSVPVLDQRRPAARPTHRPCVHAHRCSSPSRFLLHCRRVVLIFLMRDHPCSTGVPPTSAHVSALLLRRAAHILRHGRPYNSGALPSSPRSAPKERHAGRANRARPRVASYRDRKRRPERDLVGANAVTMPWTGTSAVGFLSLVAFVVPMLFWIPLH